ncbi:MULTISPECIES: sugar ABC transporter ATP-binding protein [unclassified Rathayibacter]|uniref:sugar ABC transporter ATP-binding protein n=1 Tax=unclassified Rathayibacter TaxID=2609250 RepID=UPI000CE91E43|nr:MULTISPECIES: sugar ABC transporter ATP-binding protein [unclassified Rathayibacter]PPF37977.1 lipase [Rathayibacter sp. AY1A3]PPG92802.1 lipase [Rathayibacter sp. AY1F3]QHC75065.1 ATP-binding cassette domain-containing protein [Rathayibacter sp. VKM Ac-2805]
MTDAPPGTTAPILSARGITKRFGGVTALDGVSLDLIPGEVHCLAGENGCGKSTLIKIISGAERPDAGEISIDGDTRSRMDTTSAITSGIQVIYQDFSLFPNLTVAENIVLTSAVAAKHRLYRAGTARPRAKAIVDELQLDLDLDADVADLSVADKQLTAICRALVNDARVIIMDEPTTALTHTEVARLFTIVERLRSRGVALAFVSHKLEEVLEISQRVTIMRSGRVVTSGPVADFDRRSIAEHMTGRELDESRIVSTLDESAPPMLEVVGLSRPGAFHDVSFSVRPGEILGITGLLGSGRTEIAEAVFGSQPAASGIIAVDGAPTAVRSIRDAVRAGIGYVPEDRLSQGLFLEKPIADNIIAGSLDAHRTPWRSLDKRRIRATIDRLFAELSIKAPNPQAPVRSLSGGNAQRVVIAKWLATDPKVLILNGPTVGVDVGSKSQILELLRREAARGMAVVVISDDAPELVACCHRVLVVARGRIAHELRGDEITAENLQNRMAV